MVAVPVMGALVATGVGLYLLVNFGWILVPIAVAALIWNESRSSKKGHA